MQNCINSWSYGVVLYEIFTLGMFLLTSCIRMRSLVWSITLLARRIFNFEGILQIIVSHFVRIYGLDSIKSIKHSQLIWYSHTRTKLKQLSFLYVVRCRGITPLDLHNYSYHTRPYSIIVIYYIIFPVGGTPYPDWNEWKVVYEIKVNKHRMSQPEHISDEL